MKNLVILAGGKSSRMGQDKVMLKICGKTFIEHLYEKATVFFDRIIISTDGEEHASAIRDLPSFYACRGENLEIVTDLYKETGPLGGLLSVFEMTDVNRFSVISVDVPRADMSVLEILYEKCENGACLLNYKEDRPETLIAAYDRELYPRLKDFFDRGIYKLRAAVPIERVKCVLPDELSNEFPELKKIDFTEAFKNYNTQEELKTLYD